MQVVKEDLDGHSRVLDYLQRHSTLTLATWGNDSPWAADVFYANDRFVFYFLSDPKSRHCRNIAASPSVALTVHGEYKGWREIRGVQAEGVAQPVEDDGEDRAAWELYLAKFPFVRELYPLGLSSVGEVSSRAERALDEMARRLGSVRMYRITVTRLYYMDNATGFGNRQEIAL